MIQTQKDSTGCNVADEFHLKNNMGLQHLGQLLQSFHDEKLKEMMKNKVTAHLNETSNMQNCSELC